MRVALFIFILLTLPFHLLGQTTQRTEKTVETKTEVKVFRTGERLNPLPLEKWEVSYFEKKWNMNVKGISFDSKEDFKILLVFLDDMEKIVQHDLGNALNGKHHFLFYLLDEDNVAVKRIPLKGIEGERIGRKGDAFRLIVKIPMEIQARVKRVEVRPISVPVDNELKPIPLGPTPPAPPK